MANAERVFHSRAAAEDWLLRPAFGLGHMRPADLLRTPQRSRLVIELLNRIEHGIYC